MSSKNRKHLRIIAFVLLVILSNSEGVFANNLKEIVNLKGMWKFSIGDHPDWKNPDYNDKDWDKIYVPRSWEGNGYNDYNGLPGIEQNSNYWMTLLKKLFIYLWDILMMPMKFM
jgi:hypothetical protein